MKKNLTSSPAACVQAKPSTPSVAEALLNVARSVGQKDQFMAKIRREDRMLCYRTCLSYYRDFMLSELKDDDECSDHPEAAKQIHTFANTALQMLLANPALPPGEMIDMLPKTTPEHFFEKNYVLDLFLFLETIHNILFPQTQEA